MSQPEDQARPGQKPEEKDSPRKPTPDERQEQKRDLTSWWRNFKRSDKKAPNLQGRSSFHWSVMERSDLLDRNV